MSSHHDDVVRSLLRPSENLQCLLDVELAADGARNTDRTEPTPFRRRLIAVVTHCTQEDTEVGRWVPICIAIRQPSNS